MANNGRNVNGGPQLTWVNIIVTIGLLTTLAGGAWVLFQNQFNTIEQQMRAQDNTNAAISRDIRVDLDRLRDNSVLRAEHIEFVKRLDGEVSTLQRRLDIIEATRPTTGELQSRASALSGQIDELKERLKFLEQAPRPKEVHP